jgi:ligand-binding sensor domain-containing protein
LTKPSNLKAVNLLVALFLCLCTLVQAQDYTASTQHYGPEIGLAHREVNAVFQGRQGFMWFGSKFGHNRFDGIHFTPYTQQANGLDFDDIQSIAQDADGLLWLMGPANTSSITLFNPLQAAATRH